MKIYLFLVLLALHCSGNLSAQQGAPPAETGPLRHLAGVSVHLPISHFSDSHSVGFGMNYSRTDCRFGDAIRGGKLLSWLLDGGINYFRGKKIIESGHAFRYRSYINLYAGGGAIINPMPALNLSLTAGPSLDVYRQSANLGLRLHVTVNYFVSPRIAAGAGFAWLKHLGSESLMAPCARISYAF